MRVIAKSTLTKFLLKHAEAREKMLAWYKTMEACDAKDFNDLKRTFKTADYVPKKFTVFDVGGNAYRIVVNIHYNTQKAYICLIGTHAEYDKWTRENRGK